MLERAYVTFQSCPRIHQCTPEYTSVVLYNNIKVVIMQYNYIYLSNFFEKSFLQFQKRIYMYTEIMLCHWKPRSPANRLYYTLHDCMLLHHHECRQLNGVPVRYCTFPRKCAHEHHNCCVESRIHRDVLDWMPL